MEAKDKTQDVYQEELQQVMGGLSQEQLIEKIKACQEVVDKFASDPVWKVVLADARMWVERLDAKWQEVYDEKSMLNLRVLKLAYNHIAQLPGKYKTDLIAAQKALDGLRNTDSSIQKDYDGETNIEDGT